MASRGRGRGGFRGGRAGPTGPMAKDDDGTVIDSTPAGPPPLFPEVLLPAHPDIPPKTQLLLMRKHDLSQAVKHSPFFLEAPKEKLKSMDIDARIERWAQLPSSSSSLVTGAAAVRRAMRRREPLMSVMQLLPAYFPEELYGSKKVSAKVQESYWRRAGKKSDPGGLQRLDALAQMESKAEDDGGERQGGDEEVEEEGVHDSDDEEEMDEDDYYQGENFDDDEGYDDGGDDGGADEGPLF